MESCGGWDHFWEGTPSLTSLRENLGVWKNAVWREGGRSFFLQTLSLSVALSQIILLFPPSHFPYELDANECS